MENRRSKYLTILFWGSLWGIIEASFGYLLHFISIFPGFSGIFLFPAAVWILRNVYKNTSSASDVFLTGVVAAAIKSVDFLFPHLPAIKTLNPIMAILGEALLLALFMPRIVNEVKKLRLPALLFASIGWRIIFIFINLVVFFVSGDGILKYGIPVAARFILLDGVFSSVMVWALLLIPYHDSEKNGSNKKILVPVAAPLMFLFAIGTEILFLNL